MVSNVGITIRPKAGRNCNVHYHVRASNANALEAKRGVRKYVHKGGEEINTTMLFSCYYPPLPASHCSHIYPRPVGIRVAEGYNCPLPCFLTVVALQSCHLVFKSGLRIVIYCQFLFQSSFLKPQIPGVLKHPQHSRLL